MGYIDLLALLRAQNGALHNVEIYGVVASRLNRPSNIFPEVELEAGGIFVKVDVFAVNLKAHRSYLQAHGYADDVYMVNGSLVAFVKSEGYVYPDWYGITGTLRFGSKNTADYVSLLDYKREGSNWRIGALKPRNIEISSWVSEGDCYKWVYKSLQSGEVEHPDCVNAIRPFVCLERRVTVSDSLSGSLTVAQNGVEINSPVRAGVKRFVRESRDEVLPYSEVVVKMQSLVKGAEDSSLVMFKQEFSEFKATEETPNCIRSLAESIRKNLKNRENLNSQTGRALLTSYLSGFGSLSTGTFGGVGVVPYLIGEFDEIMQYMFEGAVLSFSKAPYNLCTAAFSSPEKFFAGILTVVTGVDLRKAVSACEDYGVSFSKLVIKNPYGLCLLAGVSFKDAEYLALCLGVNTDGLLRNIAVYDSHICSSSDGATVYPEGSLRNIGVVLTEARYLKVRQNGHYLSMGVVADMHCFFGADVVGYDYSKFTHVGSSYIMRVGQLATYISSGVGVSYNGYITSVKLLKKELYIYQRMWSLGNKKTNYSLDEINECIAQYEKMEGITLEEKQKDSVRLLQHCAGVTAGGAGSGKTTTSKCLMYVLQCLDCGTELICSAPTGKAARRMQEVTHHGVKTMHAAFKIGMEETEEDAEVIDGVYLFDENAMVTLDLMYYCLKRISDESKIYLFGDFDQLPPIGKGLPFKNLLRFMPCVFLEVSKRAAEGSDITRNADIIVRHSEPGDFVGLTDGKDFKLVACQDKDIPATAVSIVQSYLGLRDMSGLPDAGKIRPDDIQVVTPYAKPGCAWGAVAMNKLLQPLFNPVRGYSKAFVVGDNLFLEGDRVIHTERNMYSMQWYANMGHGVYQKLYGFGICNGEVGRICGVVRDITIEAENGLAPSGFKYPNDMRDDTSWDGYFIDVEYPDYIYGNSGMHILYRCREDRKAQSAQGKVMKGEDLSRLMLFYAGTVHKMQGSQAKVVISLLGNVPYKGFVTRNMVYTGFTRAEKVAIGVGSVGNDYASMLSKARQDTPEVPTVGELFV